jgi:DNA-binding cell septation regulator SpoVG
MKVTQVNVFPVEGKSELKAFAQVVIEDELKLTGLKLFGKGSEFYLTYPKNPKSKKDLCFSFPMSSRLKNHITEEVVKNYENN